MRCPKTRCSIARAARADAILGAARGAPGTMAAVSASPEALRFALADVDGVTLANLNAPEQTVIAGSDAAIAGALERLAAAGFSAKRIPVACAFHSPIVAAGSESFGRALADIDVRAPELDVYANATADRYPHDPEAVRDLLAGQIALPVRFAKEIERMYEDGARVFVEAGPGGVLTDLVGRILKGRPHLAVRCDCPSVHGLEGLLLALAELAVNGVDVHAPALFRDREARGFDLASPPRPKKPKAGWMISGTPCGRSRASSRISRCASRKRRSRSPRPRRPSPAIARAPSSSTSAACATSWRASGR